MNKHFDPARPRHFHDEYFHAPNECQRALGNAIRRCVMWTIAALAGLYEAFSLWLLRRHQIRVLQSMDDRMLSDIGVGRGEIPALVRSAVPHRDHRDHR